MKLPYLPPWYRIATEGARVVLEYGQRIVCMEGTAAEHLVPALLPLLDGTRTVDEIVAILGEPVRPAVENALAELDDHGLVAEGPPYGDDLPRPVAGSVELLTALRPGTRVVDTAVVLGSCSVGVVGGGGAGLEAARLLRVGGVRVERLGRLECVDLVVCAPAAGELPRLPEWNAQALASAQPWLQVLPFDGRYATVGRSTSRVTQAATSASAGVAARISVRPKTSPCSMWFPLPTRRRRHSMPCSAPSHRSVRSTGSFSATTTRRPPSTPWGRSRPSR